MQSDASQSDIVECGLFLSPPHFVEIVIGNIKPLRILAGNRTYFIAVSLLRSRLLSRATKIILYKTLIRPVVSYGVEA